MRANIAIVMNIWTVVVGILMVVFTVKVYKKYDKEYTPKFDKEYLNELKELKQLKDEGII